MKVGGGENKRFIMKGQINCIKKKKNTEAKRSYYNLIQNKIQRFLAAKAKRET
mgnify:CR=1 FL=1